MGNQVLSAKIPADFRRRIDEIRAEIAKMELICSGSLIHRMKTCGKPNCRCAQTPPVLHGPYFEWTRLEDGRLVHRTISREQAEIVKKAIDNYWAIKALIDDWMAETLAFVIQLKSRKAKS